MLILTSANTFNLDLSKTLSFILTFSQTTNIRLIQTDRVCRRQFQIDENGRKFSKWIENTVGKGDIARYEQFLLFPQCFEKTCTAHTYKSRLVWERVDTSAKRPIHLSLGSSRSLTGVKMFCHLQILCISKDSSTSCTIRL